MDMLVEKIYNNSVTNKQVFLQRKTHGGDGQLHQDPKMISELSCLFKNDHECMTNYIVKYHRVKTELQLQALEPP
jgi:hypothetical protein